MTTVLSLWKGRIEINPLRAACDRIVAEVAAEAGVSTTEVLNTYARGGKPAVASARRRAYVRIAEQTGAPIAHIARTLGVNRKGIQRALNERGRA